MECTVCDHPKHGQPRDHAEREQHSEQWYHRENQEPHHHNIAKRDDHSDQTWSFYRGNLIWRCFMTALFIFGTHCCFWFFCFLTTSIISASTAPKTTLQPLLQEVVTKDEPDEEGL